MPGDKIVYPRNLPQYEELLRKENRLVVVMFTKNDCGSCDNILPHVQYLSNICPKVLFIVINTGLPKFASLAKDIKVFPTFKFYKNRQLAATVVGAFQQKLDENVEKLSFDKHTVTLIT